jgi:hypothetical protein
VLLFQKEGKPGTFTISYKFLNSFTLMVAESVVGFNGRKSGGPSEKLVESHWLRTAGCGMKNNSVCVT